ncbi:shikimate dehydrogenase [Marinilabiliaceae bacterium JC017]|nr:shikimate dehydrogenase [Marinilabiliaceae bacterium JC017]
MKTFGLIGYPLTQSFSQKYFSEKFQKEEIDARYLNFPIPSIKEFQELLKHHAYICGLNVTIPYKEQVIPYLNSLDETAAKIGAVNVIKVNWVNKKPILKGYNSDIIGFKKSLEPLLKTQHQKALILGTGGASKAVAFALSQLGITYRYVSRTPDKSAVVGYNQITEEILSEYKLIINSTPLGMFPKTDVCPAIPYQAATPEHLFYDLIYNPEETLFMTKAKENGAVIKNGLEMLHGQAEEAWRIWNKED